MAKELSDFLNKFNSLTETSPADYQVLFNYISNEVELSSKIFKVLESFQNKFIKFPSDLENNLSMMKYYFCQQLVTKNKNLFDFIMSWMINLYYKIEENEKLVLDLYFENILNNNFAKIDLVKKFNIEENYFFKLIKIKLENLENLQKISYVQDCIEKKSGGGVEKTRENLIKSKNKKILEILVNNFGRNVLDYYMMIACYKIKSNPNKLEIDQEKWIFKNICKFYKNVNNYLYEILLNLFNPEISANIRKLILFLYAIFLKYIGLIFVDQFIRFIKETIKIPSEFIILKNLDFSILSENYTYVYQNLDTTIGFTKFIENFLYEMIGTQNLKLEDKEQIEINETKIINKLNCLKNFILLMETFINKILFHPTTNTDIVILYNFYYFLQLKFIKKFVIFLDINKKKYYENQVNIGNISKVLPKYNKKYEEINSIFSEIISLFYNKTGTSLIFQNWLIFLFKNGSIIDAYKALRIFLLTQKDGGQIYTLLKMHHEISKFYPSLWKIILDSFLIDSSNRNSEENFNLITNLKFIFYYEISLKSSSTKNLTNRSNFYDSLSYNCTVILKFFREKFSILTSIFFSDENIIDNMMTSINNPNNQIDMDICFDTYIKQTKKFIPQIMDVVRNNYEDMSIDHMQKFETEKVHSKTKIQILNILSFLLNTYNDTDIINYEINKFVIDLIDLLVEKGESDAILDYVANIFKIILKIYKKSVANSKIVSAPIKIIFYNFVKHILNKIISYDYPANKTNKSDIYFKIFKEIFIELSNNSNEIYEVSNLIIFTIKELIYKNVDNQSFKNPIILKNMQGLNDIDHIISEKEYIIDLLSLLDIDNHISFYGFYLRYIKYSIEKLKADKVVHNNLMTVLHIFLKTKWIPQYYIIIIEILPNLSDIKSIEKILIHICNYLREFPPVPASTSASNSENAETKTKFKIRFKTIVFENIKFIK